MVPSGSMVTELETAGSKAGMARKRPVPSATKEA
jgi:hypothetical protein